MVIRNKCWFSGDMKKIYLLVLFFIIFSFNVFASEIFCELNLKKFYAKTGNLTVEFKIPHDDFKFNLKYKETSKYGLVIDNFNWDKSVVRKIKNPLIYSKKDFLKIFKNKKHKITIREIEEILNIKVIELSYKFPDKKTFRNQLLIRKLYSEAPNLNNEFYKLIKKEWVIDTKLIDKYTNNKAQESIKVWLRSISAKTGYLFNFDNEKIKNYASHNAMLMTKEIDNNTDLESKIFYSQNDSNIKNTIRYFGLAGDTDFILTLDGNCDNAPQKLMASNKSNQFNKKNNNTQVVKNETKLNTSKKSTVSNKKNDVQIIELHENKSLDVLVLEQENNKKITKNNKDAKIIISDLEENVNNELTQKEIIKKEQTVVVKKDLEGPRITINNTFESDNEYTAYIEGRITDQSEIVSLLIDGDEVSVDKGTFNKPLYVKRGGQEVQIIARDKHGNKTKTSVQLVRATIIVEEEKLDFLDPRKIKAKPNKNAVALIIGVEEYENTVAAPYASKDAEIFSEFANLSLGIPVTNIKLLTNNDAKLSNTLIALKNWLPKKIIPDKTELYVFYAGHGLASEDNNDLYLLPSDGVPSILDRTTLLRNNIFDIIAELNPRRVTMFFDTCYSGSTRSEEVMVAARPIQLMEDQAIPYEFNIFSASSINETAKVLDEAEHGLFSYFMMKGLEGEADSNNDKQITNGELYEFILSNVSRFANQTPQLNGDPDQVLVQW